ncbi:MAG: UDP-N-acetylmuramoyl-L-alanine--D-glutamate ligase [Sphingobacteriia bacterium]|nr:UDP-N-acetylmuramoyl-L-alanine--D-glutamate ligase [Sphingobacteriia bacterium]NCC39533.1 UDP-N-acetylmuramoyl-L-alanine--D-glutamate ligase [Gammaproteobacteria bacterium]
MSPASTGIKNLIVGLGKTGLSCARHLRAHGEPVVVIDSRARPPGLDVLRAELPDVEVRVGGFDPACFMVAERLILSPGVALAEPCIQAAVARGCEVIGDVELFAHAARAPVCAITGSNGKSTVTTLVGQMVEAAGERVAVGGNLGEPALALLDAAVERYVIELSSFQLETTLTLHADVAAVLNLSPDHLDRYPTLDDYAQAKGRIYRGARVAVVNRDDPIVVGLAREATGRLIGFTLDEPRVGDFGLREHAGQTWICWGDAPLMPAGAVRIPGRHNLANALAALAIVAAAGLPMASSTAVLRRFAGLPHRSELIVEHDGIRWYDDSKGTNPGATVAALDGLVPPGSPGRAVLIAGGDGKGADFMPLLPAVRRAARAVVLIGRDAAQIARVLSGQVTLVHASSMREAVIQAAALAQPGDSVLLSPACASFDMFEGFEQRGRVFAEAVRELAS